jgi:hypothetical protein
MLKARYRAALDAYQFVANRNYRLAQAGITPSDEQRDDERLAAEMVANVRSELLGVIGSLKR